jgi:surface polysaccharide O-acyltransferase-like enzyme
MTDYLSTKIRVVSFFAIILVFLQHSINFTGYIAPDRTYIGQGSVNTIAQYVIGFGFARPAVALFFLLSGYLFFRNFILAKTFEKYRSRFRTLFIPYILWNTLALLFIIGLQLLPATQSHLASFYTGYLPGRSIFEYVQSIVNHGVAFQLWFLYDLMLYTLFAPVIYLLVKYLSFYLLIPLCLLWFFCIPVPSYLAFLNRGGLFYFIGAYLAMRPAYISENVSKKLFYVMGIFWLLSIAVKTYITFLPTGFIQYLPIIDNKTIILGLLTIWFGYDIVVHTKIVSFLRTQAIVTFFIYAAHEPLLELGKYVGITIIGRSDVSLLLSYFLVPTASYILCVGLATFLKRYLVSVYNILTGGR